VAIVAQRAAFDTQAGMGHMWLQAVVMADVRHGHAARGERIGDELPMALPVIGLRAHQRDAATPADVGKEGP
jgi:hypothetical protein